MSWEESRRNEQVFRKTKLNSEVILKTIEDENGKINIILSLKNNEIITELTLTIEEWESIILFLNKTSEKIIQEINNKLGRTLKESPLTKFFKPSKAEVAQQHIVKIPAAEVITEIKSKSIKMPAAEVITESEVESVEMPAAEEIAESEVESVEVPAAEEIIESEVESVEVPAAEEITESEVKSVEMPAEEEIAELEFESMKLPEIERGSKLIQEMEQPLESQSIPVPNELFDELTMEIKKITPIQNLKSPEIDNTQFATEIEPQIIAEEEIPEEKILVTPLELPEGPEIIPKIETKPTNSMDIKGILDLLNNFPQASGSTNKLAGQSELDTKIQPIISPPMVPKIPEPSKEQLEALLTPIKQPKISIMEKFEDEAAISNEDVPSPSQTEAKKLLEEVVQPTSISPPPKPIAPEFSSPGPPSPVIGPISFPVTLGKEDESLTPEEKEARIISAMEEVAALMPPGPAQKFIEEMMLKRAEKSDLDKPRIPKLNNSESKSEANSESKSEANSESNSESDQKKSNWKYW